MKKRASHNTYRFLVTDPTESSHYSGSDFTESDVWPESTRSDSVETRTPPPAPVSRRATRIRSTGEPKSVPVNIPDWSKILREEFKESVDYFNGDGNGEAGEYDVEVVPPHEYLASTRMASMSVEEGIGRTLKGRDLSQLRNAIWEITGFQD